MQAYLLVGVGGALGAMARFGISNSIGRILPGDFPLATVFINIAGSVLMGVLVGTLAKLVPSWSETARLFIAVGVLGGFTTFSSFSLETVLLLESGRFVPATAYVLLSVVVCVVGLYLGLLAIRGMA